MQKKQSEKKPIYKRWWFWVVVVVLALSVIGGAGKSGETSNSTKSEPSVASVETDPAVEPVGGAETEQVAEPDPELEPETVDEKADVREVFNASLGDNAPLFHETVHNDKTGRWRVCVVYSSEDIVNHAADYYAAYFGSDDEIHFVSNLYLGTTARISYGMGLLFVDEYEYVKGEENNADLLCTGTPLASYIVTRSTGEVEDVTDG